MSSIGKYFKQWLALDLLYPNKGNLPFQRLKTTAEDLHILMFYAAFMLPLCRVYAALRRLN